MIAKAWVLLVLLVPAWAVAQQKAAQPKASPQASSPARGGDTGVTYKQKTVYDFDDDTVTGSLVRPDGEGITTRGRAKQSSLIKIRQHFIPEMLKSAEDI